MNDVITLQNFSSAFLMNNGKYLLIKRSPHKKIAPNKWSAVGGKIESHEINNPITACLREIKEETGITEEHIFNLSLRYIIIRRFKNIIRQNYYYFGETNVINVTPNDEGELFWVEEEKVTEKNYTQTVKAMLEHYKNRTPLSARSSRTAERTLKRGEGYIPAACWNEKGNPPLEEAGDILPRYKTLPRGENCITVGVAGKLNGKFNITWSDCEDFE